MDWLHVYIASAAFLVFSLVALVMLASSYQIKIDLDRGAFTYLKFIWANFLKPHDKKAGDQQDALESFYKTQVRTLRISHVACVLISNRRPSTMRPAAVSSVVARTCWAWLHRN